MNSAPVGTRIYWAGNFGAAEAYGTIVEVDGQRDMVKVAWDKGHGHGPSWEPMVLIGMRRGFKVIGAVAS